PSIRQPAQAPASNPAPSPSPPAMAAPAQPSASTNVSGYVQCFTMPVEGVWIAASSGGSGLATWHTVNEPTNAYYSYQLPNGGDYAVHVGCGGSPANWSVPADSGTVSGLVNNFVCDDVTGQTDYEICLHTN